MRNVGIQHVPVENSVCMCVSVCACMFARVFGSKRVVESVWIGASTKKRLLCYE